jgi:hypothetical protein
MKFCDQYNLEKSVKSYIDGLLCNVWRQSILVSKNHALLRSVDARSGGCGCRSGGRAPLRRLRPVLRPVQRVRPRRRVHCWYILSYYEIKQELIVEVVKNINQSMDLNKDIK